MKHYLGDGLYAESDAFGGIWVRSENGIEVLNEVYFEPDVFAALVAFEKRAKAPEQAQMRVLDAALDRIAGAQLAGAREADDLVCRHCGARGHDGVEPSMLCRLGAR